MISARLFGGATGVAPVVSRARRVATTWSGRQEAEMDETCDRCGPATRAAYRVHRVSELYLCGHCASRQWRALSAQGWTIWPLDARVLAPQANQ
jgi:ribosomal protein L37E